MTRKNRDPIVEHTEAAFIDQAQAMSVSGNTFDEVAARAYRDLLPVFVRWLNDEKRRGTPDEVVLSILPAVVVSQTATAVLNTFPDAKGATTMMDALKSSLDKEWRRARDQVRTQAKA